ncbi:MAG: thioredoxin family protein [Chloroflexi bacterium]|nr:thioredoxin family protein [Chloroflexota bacterium]
MKQWHVRQLNRETAVSPAQLPTIPTLLYFRSDSCAACPTQGQFVSQLAQEWNGRLAIRKIDTDDEPETARRYGVMTLPTTIILDSVGIVKDINYGVTNTQKLNKQVASLVG